MQLPEIPVGVETDQNQLYTINPSRYTSDITGSDREVSITVTSEPATGSGVNRIIRIGPARFFSSLYSGASSSYSGASGDGRYVSFTTDATKLFVYDRQIDSIIPIASITGDMYFYGGLSDPSISTSGRYVAFRSFSDRRIGPYDGLTTTEILVYDRDTDTTITVFSRSSKHPFRAPSGTRREPDSATAFQPLISANGQYVVYGSRDIFVYDLQTKTTSTVSLGLEGTQANGASNLPSISPDGQYIVYQSNASNLVADDTNNTVDIFVYNQHTGITNRVSISSDGMEANGNSGDSSISMDGRYVVFSSNANNLVANDTNNTGDIFVHDRHTGITSRISVTSLGMEANGNSSSPSISASGRYVAFSSTASNLVADDTNNRSDIFVYDRHTGVTSRVSVGLEGVEANSGSSFPSISADGSYVAFRSDASNLVVGDTNFTLDIFVYDFLLNAIINGAADRDTLIGTFGNDRITGFGGADILTGGAGSDEFIYSVLIPRSRLRGAMWCLSLVPVI